MSQAEHGKCPIFFSATVSTMINDSPRSSAGSGSGAGTASGAASGSGVAQTSTTLSTQIRKLKNAATAPRILGGGDNHQNY